MSSDLSTVIQNNLTGGKAAASRAPVFVPTSREIRQKSRNGELMEIQAEGLRTGGKTCWYLLSWENGEKCEERRQPRQSPWAQHAPYYLGKSDIR